MKTMLVVKFMLPDGLCAHASHYRPTETRTRSVLEGWVAQDSIRWCLQPHHSVQISEEECNPLASDRYYDDV